MYIILGFAIGISLYFAILRLYLLLDWYFWYKKFKNEKIQFDEFRFMIGDIIIRGGEK